MVKRIGRAPLFPALLLLALSSGEVSGGPTERWIETSKLVDAPAIRRHTIVLGGDALEGRAPGSRGGSLAASYIAAELERLGVEPDGDGGSYFQQVPLVGSAPLAASRLVVAGLGESRELVLGTDYLLHSTGAQTQLPRPTPMVFVGYGIVAPEFDYNDYADVDVRGKVAVFLAGEPMSDDPDYFGGVERTVYSAIESKVRIALSRGAVASVLIPAYGDSSEAMWVRLQREYAFEHLELASSVPSHLAILLNVDIAAALFDEALFDFQQVISMERRQVLRSFHLPSTLSFQGSFHVRSFLAPNVVGRIPGAGGRRAREFVVVSAHYDHLGVGPAVAGDSIYNGVIDNAIGSAALLDMARILETSSHHPRRSIIVLFTTAEEVGNLGARHFLDHPPVPLSSIVANVNIDGLAFQDSFTSLIGVGAELSDIGRMLHRAAGIHGLAVEKPVEFTHGQEAFERSEQAMFAEYGIPAVLVNEGLDWLHVSRQEAVAMTVRWLESRYHTPSDDLLQPLDFDAAAEHAAVILTLVQIVTDAPRAPEWRPGVPYAYRRLLTLAEEVAESPRRR